MFAVQMVCLPERCKASEVKGHGARGVVESSELLRMNGGKDHIFADGTGGGMSTLSDTYLPSQPASMRTVMILHSLTTAATSKQGAGCRIQPEDGSSTRLNHSKIRVFSCKRLYVQSNPGENQL